MIFDEPRGTILPLGGVDLGYKGFALGLLIEALTSGLAGFGRADANEGWGASVFLQIISPDSFGGREAFLKQMDFLVAGVHNTPLAEGHSGVRVPGERSAQQRREQLANGVALHPSIVPTLIPWAERLGVPMPSMRG